ncbi:hypothetical protein [Chitinophaga sp. S165]|uniref:hypothetical protein n=1 Tax=Chitinophaga sp. S165 TaxID=2135462 RepID=UPI000D71C860|nr:hypothetical protein [Chitinophaga sp. S165]PWV56378.1 hypothetical protein C7475_101893 [Chitinophaga sp. S165]
MLDEDFFQFLEYRITEAFKETDDEELRLFWCDGVLPATNERGRLSLQHVKHHRKIVTQAFIGREGQTRYDLVLKIGDEALHSYTHNLDLKVCVPDTDALSWFTIDTEKRKIEIQLK